MSKLTTTLESLGLTKSEARAYEAGLAQDSCSIERLSRVLGMNRATLYHALYELEKKGLARKRTENGKLLVSMVREEGLRAFLAEEERSLEERKEAITSIIERLPKPKGGPTLPDVEYFSGMEGISMALDIAFRAKSKRWDVIAPKTNFFSEADEDFAEFYLRERKRRGIVARSLWEKTEKNIRVSQEVMKERRPRYLPQAYNGRFKGIVILFDTRVLFVSSFEEKQAILINSEDMHSTLSVMFDSLWSASEEC
ncbi:MAG: hypothetical protein ABA06_04070 [Parcubacteria bacterium C7867-001]|nr:MAG: hypothetical protein ABA06_04070 [Parcubacteria bacterium C7867-001]